MQMSASLNPPKKRGTWSCMRWWDVNSNSVDAKKTGLSPIPRGFRSCRHLGRHQWEQPLISSCRNLPQGNNSEVARAFKWRPYFDFFVRRDNKMECPMLFCQVCLIKIVSRCYLLDFLQHFPKDLHRFSQMKNGDFPTESMGFPFPLPRPESRLCLVASAGENGRLRVNMGYLVSIWVEKRSVIAAAVFFLFLFCWGGFIWYVLCWFL